LRVQEQGGRVRVDTGAAEFHLQSHGPFPFELLTVRGGTPRVRFTVVDENGQVFEPRIGRVWVEERGPVRVCMALEGEVASAGSRRPLGYFRADLHFFAGSATVRFVLTLGNPRRAQHSGGLWELGDIGSVFIKDAALIVTPPGEGGPVRVRCSPE